MFIVCGKFPNGMVRVFDTYDWVVDVVTVEQVKMVQAQGHKVIVDERYDFVYRAYNAALSVHSEEFEEYIKTMLRLNKFYIPADYDKYKFFSNQSDKDMVVVFCFVSPDDSDIVLYSIQETNNSYKLSCKRDARNVLASGFDGFSGNVLYIRNELSFTMDYYVSKHLRCAIFDYDLNYLGDD